MTKNEQLKKIVSEDAILSDITAQLDESMITVDTLRELVNSQELFGFNDLERSIKFYYKWERAIWDHFEDCGVEEYLYERAKEKFGPRAVLSRTMGVIQEYTKVFVTDQICELLDLRLD